MTVPVFPPNVPEPVVEFCVLRLTTVESLELQFAATVEVNVMAVPVPPFADRLMTLPEEHVLHVIVIVVAPTVTVAVPANPL